MFSTPEILEHLEVCGRCGQVCGPFPHTVAGERLTLVQACGCDASLRPRAITWPTFDFNQVAGLCRSCGAEILGSGSRWSVWFCKPCRDRACAVNKTAGRAIVPIGRHSLLHGIGLSGQPSQDAIATFVSRFHSLFDRIGVVGTWAHDVVRLNIHETGLPEDTPLSLLPYLGVVHDVDRAARFDWLLARLVEPSEENGAANGDQ